MLSSMLQYVFEAWAMLDRHADNNNTRRLQRRLLHLSRAGHLVDGIEQMMPMEAEGTDAAQAQLLILRMNGNDRGSIN